jgi:sRNA-binding protein
MEGWRQDIDSALARLAEAFPQTFVLEKYRPHRPLKVGIAADIPARCPDLERRVLSAALSVYARRVMYLRGLVASAARVDLDGNTVGEVSTKDEEHAAAILAGILAAREAKRAVAVAARVADRKAVAPAAVTVRSVEQVARQPAIPAAAAPPAAKTLRERPVLRLPAFRQRFG